jgi:hypothetical protein
MEPVPLSLPFDPAIDSLDPARLVLELLPVIA